LFKGDIKSLDSLEETICYSCISESVVVTVRHIMRVIPKWKCHLHPCSAKTHESTLEL
jgi:hypothetical protein